MTQLFTLYYRWLQLRAFAAAGFMIGILCLVGCGGPSGEPRDLSAGISESARQKVIDSLVKAGIPDPVPEIIQDRGDHWHVVLSGSKPVKKEAGSPAGPKKALAPDDGGEATPSYNVYKDGRVDPPPK